jgi:hypothetical protein
VNNASIHWKFQRLRIRCLPSDRYLRRHLRCRQQQLCLSPEMPVQALEKTGRSRSERTMMVLSSTRCRQSFRRFRQVWLNSPPLRAKAKKSLSKRRQQASVGKKRTQQEDDTSLALSFTETSSVFEHPYTVGGPSGTVSFAMKPPLSTKSPRLLNLMKRPRRIK